MLAHHLPRDRIDCRFTYGYRKAGSGYRTNTLGSMEPNPGIGSQFNLGEDSCQVSDIRIVSGIFDRTRNCSFTI
jgi:hypothetical protein